MPHLIREHHIDDICGKCKKPYGDAKVVMTIFHNNKTYESILCPNCGYKSERVKEESIINDRYKFM